MNNDASIRQDFIRALGINDVNSIGLHRGLSNEIGNWPFCDEITAPAFCRGSIIRAIGLFTSDSSPVITELNSWVDRTPDINLASVPELPASIVPEGSLREFKPLPFTMTILSWISISTPSILNALIVLLQSSDNRELVIMVLPFDIAPRIIALWVIDLSPGILISPTRWLEWLIIRLELFVIDF